MKLINPTDDELNAAFLEHVTNQVVCHEGAWSSFIAGAGSMIKSRECSHDNCLPFVPSFTTSADAVLPFVQNHYCEIKYWTGAAGERPCWRIGIEGEPTTRCGGQGDGLSFAKAAVIALLRAHGVEVEFSK